MKVGFTGTREGMSQPQKEALVLQLYELNPSEFHHGDCVGADEEAHRIVREFFPSCQIHVYPPLSEWKRAFTKGDVIYEPEMYLERDRNIVRNTELLIGAPLTKNEILRSGTWTTIRFGKGLGRRVIILDRTEL